MENNLKKHTNFFKKHNIRKNEKMEKHTHKKRKKEKRRKNSLQKKLEEAFFHVNPSLSSFLANSMLTNFYLAWINKAVLQNKLLPCILLPKANSFLQASFYLLVYLDWPNTH
jgi:hypothetical protein